MQKMLNGNIKVYEEDNFGVLNFFKKLKEIECNRFRSK